MNEKRRILLLALALGALLVTRLSGLQRELPYNLDVDAPWFIEPAFHVVTKGTLDAAYQTHPGATLIVPLALFYRAGYEAGRLTGRWRNVAELEAAVASRPGLLVVPARAFCALAGLAVVLATALLALELGLPPAAALLAAALVGLSGVHWQVAHLVRADMLLALFLLLALVACLRMLDGSRWGAPLAGAAIGLATASKWPGALGFAAVPVAVACLVSDPSARPRRARAAVALALLVAGAGVFAAAHAWRFEWKPIPAFDQFPPDFRDGHVHLRALLLKLGAAAAALGLAVGASARIAGVVVPVATDARTWTAAAAAAAALVLAAPYVFSDADRFVQGMVFEARSQSITMHGDPGLKNLSRYLTGPLAQDFGWIGLLAGMAGLALLTAGSPRRGAVLLALSGAYLGFIVMGKVWTERYTVPLVPPLAIGVAALAARLAAGGPRARTAMAALVALALIVPARRIGELERRLGLRNTRIQATEWFRTTVPVGSSAAVEEHSVILCAHCYRLQTLGGLWRLQSRPDLVVTSSWVHGYYMQNAARFPGAATTYARILADYVEIASFWPDGESADGPEIRVYRRKR